MHIVNLSDWPRRQHYEHFRSNEYPQFNLCAPVEISAMLQKVKEVKISLTVMLTYIFARSANEITNFRYRIRGDQVVEHDVVHPSITLLVEGNLFSFCAIPYRQDFSEFSAEAGKLIEQARKKLILEDVPGQDDLLYLSSIPWVAFTGVSHPIRMHPVDSIPRITWGKFTPEGLRTMMPLSVQVHHGLMDGYHVGQYFELVQYYLSNPDVL